MGRSDRQREVAGWKESKQWVRKKPAQIAGHEVVGHRDRELAGRRVSRMGSQRRRIGPLGSDPVY